MCGTIAVLVCAVNYILVIKLMLAYLMHNFSLQVAPPDKWKDGANNTLQSGGRKINENKALGKKNKYQPYSLAQKCKTCKSTLHQQGLYCHGCAYKKGLCAMCGKVILDIQNYKQSMK